jgi:hypothetical protein
MTIMVDITPEVQAELARQAASRGRALEAYAASLLEEAAHVPAAAPSKAPAKDMVELFAPLRGLSVAAKITSQIGRNGIVPSR